MTIVPAIKLLFAAIKTLFAAIKLLFAAIVTIVPAIKLLFVAIKTIVPSIKLLFVAIVTIVPAIVSFELRYRACRMARLRRVDYDKKVTVAVNCLCNLFIELMRVNWTIAFWRI